MHCFEPQQSPIHAVNKSCLSCASPPENNFLEVSSLLGLILIQDSCCRQPLTFEQFFQPRQQVTTTAIRWAWPVAVFRSKSVRSVVLPFMGSCIHTVQCFAWVSLPAVAGALGHVRVQTWHWQLHMHCALLCPECWLRLAIPRTSLADCRQHSAGSMCQLMHTSKDQRHQSTPLCCAGKQPRTDV